MNKVRHDARIIGPGSLESGSKSSMEESARIFIADKGQPGKTNQQNKIADIFFARTITKTMFAKLTCTE